MANQRAGRPFIRQMNMTDVIHVPANYEDTGVLDHGLWIELEGYDFTAGGPVPYTVTSEPAGVCAGNGTMTANRQSLRFIALLPFGEERRECAMTLTLTFPPDNFTVTARESRVIQRMARDFDPVLGRSSPIPVGQRPSTVTGRTPVLHEARTRFLGNPLSQIEVSWELNMLDNAFVGFDLLDENDTRLMRVPWEEGETLPEDPRLGRPPGTRRFTRTIPFDETRFRRGIDPDNPNVIRLELTYIPFGEVLEFVGAESPDDLAGLGLTEFCARPRDGDGVIAPAAGAIPADGTTTVNVQTGSDPVDRMTNNITVSGPRDSTTDSFTFTQE